MYLISILIALGFERLLDTTARWQMPFYARWYRDHLAQRDILKHDSSELRVWGLLLLPALILAFTQSILPGFMVFILQTLVLFVCLGSTRARDHYQHFMTAAQRRDAQACRYHLERLSPANATADINSETEVGTLAGLQLLWINYQHYIGVILWFVVFGAPGALLYALVRELTLRSPLPVEKRYRHIAKFMYALDFLPARVAAFGLLIVGDFSRALPVWLKHAQILEIPASQLMSEVALAAEREGDGAQEEAVNPLLSHPQRLVKLAKRNLLLIVVFVAILTVFGWLA